MPDRLSAQNGRESLRAGCKINLFLEITGILPDGRHSLRTLFWPLPEPHDTLHLTPGPTGGGIRLVCAAPEVDPERNTVVRAWHAFAAATGFAPDLEIVLEKGIPSGAGLGGASADAAALLLWLNRHAPGPVTPEALVDMAVSVGADVPFFLRNTPALGTGVGEVLSPCLAASLYQGLWLVLVYPPVAVDTGSAFRAFDLALRATNTPSHPETEPPSPFFLPPWCVQLLTNPHGRTKSADSERANRLQNSAEPVVFSTVNTLRNSLEPVVFSMVPSLNRLKAALAREGAVATAMSGSGSTVFGLFREQVRAEHAAQAVRSFGQVWVQPL